MVWCAALSAGEAADSVLQDIIQKAATLPASSVARLLVATWSAGASRQCLHQQLAGVLLSKAGGDESVSNAATLLPPAAASNSTLVTQLFQLLQQAWQSVSQSRGQNKLLMMPWAMDEVSPFLCAAADLPEIAPASSAFVSQLVQSLLKGGHGHYVAQHYTAWVHKFGLQLDTPQMVQLLEQAGPAKALPLLMAGVQEEGEAPGAVATGLLRALLQVAESDGASEPTILAAAAQLLSSPGAPVTESLCTTALQVVAKNAGSAGRDALGLAEAAFSAAAANNMQPTQPAAVACIRLAAHDAVATQWLEVVIEAISKAAPTTAAAWYKALLEQGIQVHTAAQDGTASRLNPALSVLLTTAGSLQVKLDAATLAGLVTVGLSTAEGGQLPVLAAQAAQRQGQFSRCINQLSPAQKSSLSSALIGAQEWSLALAASRDAEILSQIQAAAADQQLPVDVLTAALDAAVLAGRPDLTLAFLQGHVFSNSDLEGSALLAVLGGQAGLVGLCKHILSSNPHIPATAEQQQQQQEAEQNQKTVVQLVQKLAAEGDVSLNDTTWRGALDAVTASAAAHQQDQPAQTAAEGVVAMCRLASANTDCPTVGWHLYAAAKLAIAPACAPLADAVLQVGTHVCLLLEWRTSGTCIL
jgi:hypothetical protein